MKNIDIIELTRLELTNNNVMTSEELLWHVLGPQKFKPDTRVKLPISVSFPAFVRIEKQQL